MNVLLLEFLSCFCFIIQSNRFQDICETAGFKDVLGRLHVKDTTHSDVSGEEFEEISAFDITTFPKTAFQNAVLVAIYKV